MIEHHLTVPRTARYVTLGGMGADTLEVWMVCHGFAQLAPRFIRAFETIASDSRLVVAPEALNRFYLDSTPGGHARDARVGATWMTREDRLHEIADYITYLDLLHDEIFSRLRRNTVKLVVLGFSQGTATVGRWLAHGSKHADRLILWGGDLPEDLDLAVVAPILRKQAPVLVLGDGEPAEYRERLLAGRERARAHGISMELVTYAGGHQVERKVLEELAASE